MDGGKEYRIEPDIDTEEYYLAAKARGGWVHKILFGKGFIICRECNTKDPNPANAEPTSEKPAPEGTKE